MSPSALWAPPPHESANPGESEMLEMFFLRMMSKSRPNRRHATGRAGQPLSALSPRAPQEKAAPSAVTFPAFQASARTLISSNVRGIFGSFLAELIDSHCQPSLDLVRSLLAVV